MDYPVWRRDPALPTHNRVPGLRRLVAKLFDGKPGGGLGDLLVHVRIDRPTDAGQIVAGDPRQAFIIPQAGLGKHGAFKWP